ncbi:MAG TPA: type I-U CRISPR-associated protein Csb2 [Gemmatales bacterium]|nr:type I-U CRISPR-associated protein Csb2 [Gemmatales bacterium]
MFSLRVELLLPRAIMTRPEDRESAEWPPHPDRVFMALAAAWGESGEESAGKAALEWLEGLPAPKLAIALEYAERTSFTTYVPVNDDSSPIGKKGPFGQLGTVPLGRNRQPRSFPAAVPYSPVFHLLWDADAPAPVQAGITELCRYITYLGHSASPIRMDVSSDAVPPTLIPAERGMPLRVFGRGRLAELKQRYGAGLRPTPSRWQKYASPVVNDNAGVIAGPFDPALFVFRVAGGRRWGLESCGLLAKTVRDTLMSRHVANPPEWLSGHAPNGVSKLDRPAYLPLAFAGDAHADGHVLGMAIAIPAQFEHTEKLFELLCMHGVAELDEQTPFLALQVTHPQFGNVGHCTLEFDDRPDRLRSHLNLRTATWTRPAHRWVTVTPIVLPQFPRRQLRPEDVVRSAIVEAGYPEPASVRVSAAPMLSGVPHARAFHVKHREKRPPRPLIHAEIEFDQPVRGPVIVGSGRYLSFGFCRPQGE